MHVTETTNYSYDAEFSVNTFHGCRIMIKILLSLHNDLAVVKIIIRHLSAELAMWVWYTLQHSFLSLSFILTLLKRSRRC